VPLSSHHRGGLLGGSGGRYSFQYNHRGILLGRGILFESGGTYRYISTTRSWGFLVCRSGGRLPFHSRHRWRISAIVEVLLGSSPGGPTSNGCSSAGVSEPVVWRTVEFTFRRGVTFGLPLLCNFLCISDVFQVYFVFLFFSFFSYYCTVRQSIVLYVFFHVRPEKVPPTIYGIKI
jgi:hypothetical protein